jgi:exopolysaccharide biosynthesis polyprenyl glycosylphosphotransferase
MLFGISLIFRVVTGGLVYTSVITYYFVMLKQNWRLISAIERIGDNLVIVAAFLGAYFGRSSLLYWNEKLQLDLPFEGYELLPMREYLVVLLVGLIGYAVVLNMMGAYGSMRLSSVWRLFRVAFVSSAVVFCLVAAALFILKYPISRSFIALFVLLAACGLALERYGVLKLLRYWRRHGRNYRNIVICGIGDQAVHLAKELASRPELGIRVRAFADLHGQTAQRLQEAARLRRELSGFVRVGRLLLGVEDVAQALKTYAIDEVIFTDVSSVMLEVEEVILICADQGVRTTIAADIFSIGLMKSEMSYFGGMPLIHFQPPPGDSWQLAMKRGMDIFVALVALVALFPAFVLLAIGVRTTRGPVFFRQTRMGLNGRLFHMYKFRSMFVGAERDLGALRSSNEMSGPVFKMKRDPRVTSFGRFMRRFSLDELPQLWNVLIGDMSLVGPRPPIPGEVSLYDRKSRRRLSMRPGLTCTWQVSGRNDIADFNDWVALDLHYIDNWSLLRDVSLLLRTIPAVLLGTGAR